MKLKLIIGNILHNKKRTVIAILSIWFAMLLIFVSFNTYISFQNMRIQNAYEAYGEYNIILHKVDSSVYKWIYDNCGNNVNIGLEKIYGYSEDNIALISCDNIAYRMNNYSLLEGEFPTNDSEVAISATAKYEDEYIFKVKKIGDKIILNSREYVITGIINDFDFSTVDTYKVAIFSNDKDSTMYNIYLHCNNKETYTNIIDKIKTFFNVSDDEIYIGDKCSGFISDNRIISNYDLNKIELDGEGSIQDVNIGRLLICLIVIIVSTSFILSIHVFYSYYNDRHKQQGILMSIGFANKWIITCYIIESIILIIIGCLFGLLSGQTITSLIFEFIQSQRISRLENFQPQFTLTSYCISISISIIAFIIGVIPAIVHNIRKPIVHLMGSTKGNKSKINSKHFLTAKYFFRDNNIISEKIFTYISMFLIGLIFLILLCVNRYVTYSSTFKDEYDVEFQLLSEDISEMENFSALIPNVEYYDEIYDTVGVFYLSDDMINSTYKDILATREDGLIYCEIVGVSELQYNNKIELSKDVSYDEFVKTNSAIIIDNYLNTDEQFFAYLPETINYAEKSDSACFEAGEISIFARSKFLNWNDQRGIAIVVPDELFKEKFDYTNVLININVAIGSELETGEILNSYSYIFDYSLMDHTTEYINSEDNARTIKSCTLGVLIFVTIINFFSIIYINEFKYIRRKKNISILKVIGHSNTSIMFYIVIENLVKCIIAAICSSFVVIILIKKMLPMQTQDILLTNGITLISLSFIWLTIIQIISLLSTSVKIRNQKIVHDFRL